MEGTLAKDKPQAAAFSPADTLNVTSPLDAFSGNITRPKVPFLYTVGLAVVAFAMVLLPGVYISLILMVAYGVLYHVAHDAWIITTGSGGFVAKAMVYFGPIVVGCILLFFMLKPLFAKKVKRPELVSLDPAREPLLFAFVQRICEQVGAPTPCRIDVDCQVNASARLRRGIWSRDLVLTIGLPLAVGLDMRQFAGVLAHEFGHFAQGAGMRMTYVIRAINFWFARVVFERDKWDKQLEDAAKRSDYRIRLVLLMARGCIWLTRRVLWLLMHAGQAISCFMLRQMEYDADNYESKIAGCDAFESTFARMQELNVATQIAFEDVRQSWASHRLPENLPLLIHHKVGSLPAEVHQKLAETKAKKTDWFDTHPYDGDRVRVARARDERGIFHLERPATELFADFPETSRAVTRFQYEKNWKLQFTEENLVASEEMLRESAASSEADAAVLKFYGKVNVTFMPLLITGEFPPLLNRENALAQWRQTREQCEKLRPDAEKASAEIQIQQQKLVGYMAAWNLSRANFRITDPQNYGLPKSAATIGTQEIAGRQAVEAATEGIQQQLKNLTPFVAALRTRMTLAVQLSKPASAGTGESGVEMASLTRALAVVGSTLSQLHQTGLRLRPLAVLAKNRGNHHDPLKVNAHMSRIADEIRKLLDDIQSPLKGLMYPFPHPRGQLSVLEYARYEKPCSNEWEAAYQEGSTHVERLFALHYRVLGRVLVLTEKAEKELE